MTAEPTGGTPTCPHGFLHGMCNARACREADAAWGREGVGDAPAPSTPPHQHEQWQLRTAPDGSTYCAACGNPTGPPPGDLAPRSGTGVPTNAELAERARALDAHTVVREWLNRHVGHPPVGGFDSRDDWLDWAASNFLADPEIAQHLTPTPTGAHTGDVDRDERQARHMAHVAWSRAPYGVPFLSGWDARAALDSAAPLPVLNPDDTDLTAEEVGGLLDSGTPVDLVTPNATPSAGQETGHA
jgi:hypothetical protein